MDNVFTIKLSAPSIEARGCINWTSLSPHNTYLLCKVFGLFHTVNLAHPQRILKSCFVVLSSAACCHPLRRSFIVLLPLILLSVLPSFAVVFHHSFRCPFAVPFVVLISVRFVVNLPSVLLSFRSLVWFLVSSFVLSPFELAPQRN